MAGCGPGDIDVVQLYDAFTPRVVHDLVHYGFADWDEVGSLAASGQLTLGGRLPCNTAGGLLSEGHLSGMNHVAEAVRQIRGTSCNQVEDVVLSMVTGYGGAPRAAPPSRRAPAPPLPPPSRRPSRRRARAPPASPPPA